MKDRIRVWLVRRLPYHQLQWVVPGTTIRRTVSTKTADLAEAEQMRADKEYELNHGLGAEASRIGWEDFSERYLEEKLADRRRNTRSKWRTVSASFAERARPKDLGSVTPELLSRYAAELRRAGDAKPTIAGHLAYLRAALRWAVRVGLLPSPPVIEMPKLPKKTSIRKTDQAGYLRLLNAAPEGDWRLLITTAWHTGMRRGELLALEWSGENGTPWLDLERARVWLPAEWCKSDADSWLPLHPDLLCALTAARQPSGRVFRISLSANELSRGFTAIARAAGMPITLHDLRRSFACRYASKVPAPVLQRLMRHADVRTTLAFYTDIDDQLEESIKLA